MYVDFEHREANRDLTTCNTIYKAFCGAWNRDLTSEENRGGPGVHSKMLTALYLLHLRVILEPEMHH